MYRKKKDNIPASICGQNSIIKIPGDVDFYQLTFGCPIVWQHNQQYKKEKDR